MTDARSQVHLQSLDCRSLQACSQTYKTYFIFHLDPKYVSMGFWRLCCYYSSNLTVPTNLICGPRNHSPLSTRKEQSNSDPGVRNNWWNRNGFPCLPSKMIWNVVLNTRQAYKSPATCNCQLILLSSIFFLVALHCHLCSLN